jgi:hypothetical protein
LDARKLKENLRRKENLIKKKFFLFKAQLLTGLYQPLALLQFDPVTLSFSLSLSTSNCRFRERHFHY